MKRYGSKEALCTAIEGVVSSRIRVSVLPLGLGFASDRFEYDSGDFVDCYLECWVDEEGRLTCMRRLGCDLLFDELVINSGVDVDLLKGNYLLKMASDQNRGRLSWEKHQLFFDLVWGFGDPLAWLCSDIYVFLKEVHGIYKRVKKKNTILGDELDGLVW